MAQLKVSDEDMQLLGLKTDFAYETFRRAVETPEPRLIQTAECLYHHDLGDLLIKLTQRSTENFRRLNKGGKRASKIEGFIMQYVLMCGRSNPGDCFKVEIVEDLEDGMGGLRRFLEAKDDLSSEEGEVFRLIQKRSGELREAGRYDLVFAAMNYVRENYC